MDTSRSYHLKNTRERDQTHSYWYILSAPRVNYPLLVMESAGMVKMATGDGFPPPVGCRNGSRLVFGGYGGFWWRNSRSIVVFEVFRVYGYIREEEVRQWTFGLSTRQGARPPPSWTARDSSGPTLLLRGLLLVHKKSSKMGTSIGLRLVFLFCEVKNKQKTTTGTRHYVNMLVPKNYIKLL